MVKVTPVKKSRAPFFLLLLVIVAVGAGGIYYKVAGAKSTPIALAPGTPLPKAEGYFRGKPDAPLTIMEFGDFECPGCGQFANITEPDVRARIVDAGLANFRFFDFPISSHPNTMSASLAAACADHQGKFWEMHDMIYHNQVEWNGAATGNPKKFMEGYVKQLGMDVVAWNACFDSQKDVAKIEAHRAAGLALGVKYTPTFVIDGHLYENGLTYDQIKKLVDSITIAKAGTAKATPAAAAPAPASKPPAKP